MTPNPLKQSRPFLCVCFDWWIGYEASAHLAEETTNAKVNGPWGMVFNIITTCVVGFVYLLILVLCIPTVKTLTDDASDDNLIGNMVNTQYANSAIGKWQEGLRVAYCDGMFIVYFFHCCSCSFSYPCSLSLFTTLTNHHDVLFSPWRMILLLCVFLSRGYCIHCRQTHRLCLDRINRYHGLYGGSC